MARALFPPRTLALLSRQSEDNLPDSCDILERRQVRKPGGVVTETFEEVAWGVPCYVSPASAGVAGSSVVGAQVVETTRWMIRIPTSTEVPTDGQVRARIRETGKTILVAVEAVLAPRSEETSRYVLGEAL